MKQTPASKTMDQYFLGKVPKGQPGKLMDLIATITSKLVLIGPCDGELGSKELILSVFTHPSLDLRMLKEKTVTRISFYEGKETGRIFMTLEFFFKIHEKFMGEDGGINWIKR